MPTPSAFQKPQYAASKGIIRNPGAILHGAPQDDNGQGFVKQIEKSSNVVDLSTIVHKKIGGIHPQLVGKARLRRSFPTKRVSPALSARPGKRAGKPCCARLPNPPHMSARQAARWKRAACPAQARDAFSKSKLWGRHRGFGIQLGGDGGKRVPCGHLPPKVAKRPEGVNRNERRTRPAAAATIEVAGLRPSEPPKRVF